MSKNSVPRLSAKELLILKLLISRRSEWYGLELVEHSDGELKRGTIYVTLGRMEEKGLVESRREASDQAPTSIPRRLYKPTGLGERVLVATEAYADSLNAFT
jgi:DNA-binding PadR family transcriptional regulator